MRRKPLALLCLAFLCSLLAGCMVGPDFVPPHLPEGADYLHAPGVKKTAGAETVAGAPQRFVPATEIPPDWWALFHNKQLNALIEQSLAANPNVKAAEAALRTAIANARAQAGLLFPVVTGEFNASENKTPGTLSSPTASGAYTYSLFTAQVTVNYTLDVFGGIRRSIEGQDALADYQFYEARATYLMLAANVAYAAVMDASLREQIAATEEIIRLQKEVLRILRVQLEKGQIAEIDVVAQETALAQSELMLQPLRKQFAQNRNLLANLTGNFPSSPPRPAFHLRDLHLPQRVPVTLPSAMIRQRPDVEAAEATMHNASALIGVAIANRLPNFTLTADYGQSSTALSSLFDPRSSFWNIAGNAAQTIFDAGTLRERQRAAEATFDNAAATYRSTVLGAFQNVADSLRALQYDALALAAAAKAEKSANEYLNITQAKLKLGAVNVLVLIAAQQAYQQAHIALIQAQAARFSDTIALFQALGGGWWNCQRGCPGNFTTVVEFHAPW